MLSNSPEVLPQINAVQILPKIERRVSLVEGETQADIMKSVTNSGVTTPNMNAVDLLNSDIRKLSQVNTPQSGEFRSHQFKSRAITQFIKKRK